MNENKILPIGLNIPDRKDQFKWLKIISLACASVLFFGFAWQLLAIGFSQGQGLAFWILPALAAGLGTVFLAFLSVVNRNKFLFWGVGAAITLWYILALPKDIYIWISAALFFLFTAWFEQRIKHDEKSRADFSISRIMRDCINIMVYGLLLVVGFNVYLKTAGELQKNPQNFYDRIGYYAASGLKYVPSGLGDYSADQSFDDFVAKQASRQIPEFNSASSPQKQELADQVKQQLQDRFHIQVTGNPLLGNVVAGVVAEKVRQGSQSYQKFFPAIFAIIIAALLRTVAFVFVWLVLALSWLVFRLLLMIKFFRIEKVPVEVDKLQI